ncbi:MAG: BTAD domain-containing putative transcriptional regulator [Caldilineaceae bacterium]
MPTLAIALLGGFAVTAADEPITMFAYDKVRGLLAYLVVEADRPHRRDWLATLFWPDQPRRSALQSFSQALYQLRRAIADAQAKPPFLLITPQTVQFNATSDYWLDTQAFTRLLDECRTHEHRQLQTCAECLARLAQAVSLYHGPLLEGFSLPDCPEFDEWTLIQRERLQRLAIDALRALTSGYERQENYTQALLYGQRWLALEPWQEEAHCAVMRVLAASGQRSAALAQFEQCRRLLAAELAVEPSAETVALYQRIRDASDAQAAVRSPRHHLPAPLTPLIGRTHELALIEGWLHNPACRLVSLVGPGGSGKTRLALEAAMQVADEFVDGVVFVPLTAVESPAAIVPAIVQALGLAFARQEDPQRQLSACLHAQNLLLVLDNFEHLLSGVHILTALLAAAPHVKLLVTSRGQLNAQGEQMLAVAGLTLPEVQKADSGDLSVDEANPVMAADAVALFLYHAHRLRADYTPEPADLAAISQICAAVDGMPLAILLAAAWLPLLSPAAIAHQLLDELASDAHGIDFLAADWPDLPERQRSMRTVLDQAWRLLREPEQRVLAALAVFRGGFTQAAANAVAGANLHQLRSLVEKSWLHRTPENRYELHELLRQYAEEKLRPMPALALLVQDRHCAHFAAALERWAGELRGTRQLTALAELETDLANAQAAWNWALAQGELDYIEQALDGLCLFYDWRGRCQQGETLCQTAIEQLRPCVAGEQRTVVARLLAWHGFFSQVLDHLELATARLHECLGLVDDLAQAALAQDLRSVRAFALHALGHATHGANRGEAKRCWDESLALYRAVADQWGMHQVLNNLGRLAVELSDYPTAIRLLEESLALGQQLGDRKSMAHTLCYLGNAYANLGDLTKASELSAQSVALSQALGDRLGAADSMGRMAGTLAYRGHLAESAALFEQAAAIYQALGARHAYALETHLLSWLNTNLGQYDLARRQNRTANLIWQEYGHRHGLALSALGLGGIELALANFEQARLLLVESAALFAEVQQRDEQAIAFGILAAALCGLGRHAEAHGCVQQALQLALTVNAFAPLLFALDAYALILAQAGEMSKAVEIHTLVAQHSYLKDSCWRQDCYSRYIDLLVAALTVDERDAAIARGMAGDIQATASSVLAVLRRDKSCA